MIDIDAFVKQLNDDMKKHKGDMKKINIEKLNEAMEQGISLAFYCKREGLNYSCVRVWLHNHGYKKDSKTRKYLNF